MKAIFTLLLFSVVLSANAQLTAPITFEGGMADTSWTIFANGPSEDSTDISIVANPMKDEVNSSDSVLQFVVHDDADPWAGAWSDYYGPVDITAENHILTMMVHKSKIGPTGLKVEGSTNGGTNIELKVSNTVTDQWEILSFDFSDAIGYSYNRVTFFPDFPDTRTSGGTVYIDNIANPGGTTGVRNVSSAALKFFPNPVEKVMFIESSAMTGITVSNLLGQSLLNLNFPEADKKSLDLSELHSGVYFITVKTASGQQTSKFLKK